MPARTENLSSHHQPRPTKNRWPGLQTSRTAHERLVLRPCPIPGTPRKEPRGVPTRGANATRKDPASCPPLPAKSRREWLLGCRREQPPHARPTTPPAGKSTRRPTRGATCGASANSTHLARHTRYTATGSAFTLVIPNRKAPCPMPATPGKEPPGVATRMPLAQKDNSMLAVACHPFAWTKSRQGERVTIHTRNRPG